MNGPKLKLAVALLQEHLPATVPELKEAAVEAGLNWITVKRAAAWLHVNWSREHGYQSVVTWRLPEDNDTEEVCTLP